MGGLSIFPGLALVSSVINHKARTALRWLSIDPSPLLCSRRSGSERHCTCANFAYLHARLHSSPSPNTKRPTLEYFLYGEGFLCLHLRMPLVHYTSSRSCGFFFWRQWQLQARRCHQVNFIVFFRLNTSRLIFSVTPSLGGLKMDQRENGHAAPHSPASDLMLLTMSLKPLPDCPFIPLAVQNLQIEIVKTRKGQHLPWPDKILTTQISFVNPPSSAQQRLF